MFVVDLMHEVELNVFKSLFIHLLRILNSVDNALVVELDRRYGDSSRHLFVETLTSVQRFRELPSFGKDTIRRFSNNVSGLRKLAARDFENIFQVRVCGAQPLEVRPVDCMIVRYTSLRGSTSRTAQ
jgi:hypothetical protein